MICIHKSNPIDLPSAERTLTIAIAGTGPGDAASGKDFFEDLPDRSPGPAEQGSCGCHVPKLQKSLNKHGKITVKT